MGDQEILDKLVAEKAEGGFTKQERREIRKEAKELTDVSVNLAYARMAVSFVKQKVPLVANWDEPVSTSFESILRGADTAKSSTEADRVVAKAMAARDKADRCVYDKLRRDSEWERIDSQLGGVQDLQDIQILSDLADHHGCGNCGEMTAVTFMYLYNLDIRPLDFMTLKKPADHAFVVIGRKRGAKDDILGRNWDANAVVCDPWASGLYFFRDWPWYNVAVYADLRLGDSYAAYSSSLLEQNMKAMHKTFSGVKVILRVSN